MNTQTAAKHIIEIAKEKGAQFCEAVVTQNEFSLKRIRQGQVDQPPAGEQWGIDIGLAKDGKMKTASFDNPSFAPEIIEQAMRQLELLPEYDIHLPKEAFQSTN